MWAVGRGRWLFMGWSVWGSLGGDLEERLGGHDPGGLLEEGLSRREPAVRMPRGRRGLVSGKSRRQVGVEQREMELRQRGADHVGGRGCKGGGYAEGGGSQDSLEQERDFG